MPVFEQTVGRASAFRRAISPHVLFELHTTEARCNRYGDVVLPEPRSWRVTDTSPWPDASLAPTMPGNPVSAERV
jgi:hypothetical protein